MGHQGGSTDGRRNHDFHLHVKGLLPHLPSEITDRSDSVSGSRTYLRGRGLGLVDLGIPDEGEISHPDELSLSGNQSGRVAQSAYPGNPNSGLRIPAGDSGGTD